MNAIDPFFDCCSMTEEKRNEYISLFNQFFVKKSIDSSGIFSLSPRMEIDENMLAAITKKVVFAEVQVYALPENKVYPFQRMSSLKTALCCLPGDRKKIFIKINSIIDFSLYFISFDMKKWQRSGSGMNIMWSKRNYEHSSS